MNRSSSMSSTWSWFASAERTKFSLLTADSRRIRILATAERLRSNHERTMSTIVILFCDSVSSWTSWYASSRIAKNMFSMMKFTVTRNDTKYIGPMTRFEYFMET
eukprot:Amastigsp_a509421_52.p2 type:complete len:105 gc:universal Amastigsp_a509421_52:1862-1548(-)